MCWCRQIFADLRDGKEETSEKGGDKGKTLKLGDATYTHMSL